jgi:hypothetical protein
MVHIAIKGNKTIRLIQFLILNFLQLKFCKYLMISYLCQMSGE